MHKHKSMLILSFCICIFCSDAELLQAQAASGGANPLHPIAWVVGGKWLEVFTSEYQRVR